ncbi:MAG TPA: hypothetical protein VI248_20350 [Kineosporiaceae bacterium]
MSAGITFYCDVDLGCGTCPQSIHLRTTDLAEARAAAEHYGWRLSEAGDRCALYHGKPPRPPAPTNLASQKARRDAKEE